MDTERADGKAILLIILLLVVILGTLGIAKLQNKEFSPEKVKEKIDNVLKTDNNKKDITKGELEVYVKTKMIDKGLAKPELIEKWTFDSYKKLGYLSDNPNVTYYLLGGEFKCTGLEEGYEYPTCVYQEQLGDPDEQGYYQWTMYVEVTSTDGEYEYGEILGDGSFQDNELFVKAE